MKEKIRIGILGGGIKSAVGRAHISAIRMSGRYEIGPCRFSHEATENQLSHEEFSVKWCEHDEDHVQWLEKRKNELDLVLLLTPSPDHPDQIIDVISQGIHILTEKPVTCSAKDLRMISNALVDHPSVSAHFVHNYSGYPLFRELVLRVRSGAIGKVHNIRIEMPSDIFARERILGKPQIWRQSDPDIPMIMLDLGTHMFHLIQMIAGYDESRIYANLKNMVSSLGVIDNVEIWQERQDGIQVNYWMSKAHLGIKNGLKIDVYGADGSLSWTQMDPDHLVQADLDSNRTIVDRGAISKAASCYDRFKAGHPTGFIDAFSNFYCDVANELCGNKSSSSNDSWVSHIDEAFAGIRFLDAAVHSHKSGEWISL